MKVSLEPDQCQLRTLLPEATVYLDVEDGQEQEGDDAGAQQPGMKTL